MSVFDELRWRMMEQRPEWATTQGQRPHCTSMAEPVTSCMEDKPESFMFRGLSEAITSLTRAVRGLATSQTKWRISALEETVKTLMATQQELAADLRASVEQQKKTQAEIRAVQAATNTLKEKVKELEEIIANNPSAQAIPELVQAVADVKAQSQVVDDEIPDPAPEARAR